MSSKKYLFEFRWPETYLFKDDYCFREWSWIPQIGMSIVLKDDDGFDTRQEYWEGTDLEEEMPVTTILAGEVISIEFEENIQEDFGYDDYFRVILNPEE